MNWHNVRSKARAVGCSPIFPGSIIALFIALGLPAGAALAADCVVPTTGATGPVTLRAAPAASSARRGTLSPGQNLPLVALVPGWYETRLADGQMAFAAKRSTEIAPCPDSAGAPAPSADVTYELHAIDVGTGLAVLVRGADFDLLYDAGSNDDMARGDNNRAIAYLKTLQPPVRTLNHVILSHPHRDHVELLPDIVTLFKPKEVWNSGAYNNICGYRNFLFAIAADPSVQYHTATQDGGTESIEMAKKTLRRRAAGADVDTEPCSPNYQREDHARTRRVDDILVR